MTDLILGIAFFVAGYFLEASFLNGDPAKFYYSLDILGGLLVISGLYKLVRGTNMDDR